MRLPDHILWRVCGVVLLALALLAFGFSVAAGAPAVVPAGVPLAPGVTVMDPLNAEGSTADYTIEVPGGTSSLGVVLAGPPGQDFDLYVRRGAAPDPKARIYDAASAGSGADETAQLAEPAAGTYHVTVLAYRGTGYFQLTAVLCGGAQAACLSAGSEVSEALAGGGPGRRYQLAVPASVRSLRVDAAETNGSSFWLNIDGDREQIRGSDALLLHRPFPGMHALVLSADRDIRYRLTVNYVFHDPAQPWSDEAGDPSVWVLNAGGSVHSGSLTFPAGGKWRTDVDNTVIENPGRLAVTVECSACPAAGAVLKVIINGPPRLELADPMTPYAEAQGSNVIEASYDVAQDDLRRGKFWTVGVVNTGGQAVNAHFTVETPNSPVVRGAVSGRVLWDTRGVPGAQALLKETNSFNAPTVASAKTGADGAYRIDVGPGTYYLFIQAPGPEYWSWFGAGSLTVKLGPATNAPDVYLARYLQLLAPPNGATGMPASPTLSWRAFPGAVSYSVAVFDEVTGQRVYSVQDVHATSVRVPGPLARGHAHQWSVDAFNAQGHRIAYYSPYRFTTQQGLPAPVLLSPPNGATFNVYPRHTVLRWAPVPGAAGYTVEIDCYQCCQKDRWCTDVGRTWIVKPNLTGATYAFDWVGAQPGRWRVRALDAEGRAGPTSGWREFRYTR